jgi:hypothetical protein
MRGKHRHLLPFTSTLTSPFAEMLMLSQYSFQCIIVIVMALFICLFYATAMPPYSTYTYPCPIRSPNLASILVILLVKLFPWPCFAWLCTPNHRSLTLHDLHCTLVLARDAGMYDGIVCKVNVCLRKPIKIKLQRMHQIMNNNWAGQ